MRQSSLKDLAARCLGIDKSPSVSSVSASTKESEKFSSLSPDLERRICAMAGRWRYTADELAEVLELARHDPGKWSRAIALDERRFGEDRAVWKPDA